MTEYASKWSDRKRAAKAAEVARHLLPGERVIYQGLGGTWRPLTNDFVVTDRRVFTYAIDKIGVNVHLSHIAKVESGATKITMTDCQGRTWAVTSVPPAELERATTMVRNAVAAQPHPPQLAQPGSHTLPAGLVSAADAPAASSPPSPTAAVPADLSLPASTSNASMPSPQGPEPTLLGATVRGGTVTKKAQAAIARLCYPGERPWLVLCPGGAEGVMVVFNDRLAIVKTGALTSFMAGSLGGERSTTFYFRDINALEYNSGMLSGVLEVLTASYQGSANKDYWRGTTKSRNANSDDPWTLSNTLPMAKALYNQWTPDIQKIRSMISESKNPAPQGVPPGPAPKSLAEQIRDLAALRDAGLLTEEEFVRAKGQLLA